MVGLGEDIYNITMSRIYTKLNKKIKYSKKYYKKNIAGVPYK